MIPSAANTAKTQITASTDVLIGLDADDEVSDEELAEADGSLKAVATDGADRDPDDEEEEKDARTVALDALGREEEARGVISDTDIAEEVDVEVEVIAELVIGAEVEEVDGGPTMLPVTEGMGGGPVSVRCRK